MSLEPEMLACELVTELVGDERQARHGHEQGEQAQHEHGKDEERCAIRE